MLQEMVVSSWNKVGSNNWRPPCLDSFSLKTGDIFRRPGVLSFQPPSEGDGPADIAEDLVALKSVLMSLYLFKSLFDLVWSKAGLEQSRRAKELKLTCWRRSRLSERRNGFVRQVAWWIG